MIIHPTSVKIMQDYQINLSHFNCKIKQMVYIGSPASALIGKIERGFDFLGYHFGPEGLSIAQKTLYNFAERAIWLYEQEPGEPRCSTRLWGYCEAILKDTD